MRGGRGCVTKLTFNRQLCDGNHAEKTCQDLPAVKSYHMHDDVKSIVEALWASPPQLKKGPNKKCTKRLHATNLKPYAAVWSR